jgi:mono/diheme cytochrome c family protein
VSDDYSGSIFRVVAGSGVETRTPRTAAGRRPDADAAPSDVDPLADLGVAERDTLSVRGRQLFSEHACGSCHVEGQTDPGVVVKPLEGLDTKFTIASLADFFLVPQPPMPVFDLPEEDRRALAVFLFSNSDTVSQGTVEGSRATP